MASKLPKVLKRTLIGATMIVVLVLIFNAAWETTSGLVLWVTGVLLAVGSVFELCRMSRIVPRELVGPLWLGLILALAPGFVHYFGEDLLGSSELLGAPYLSSRGVLSSYLLGSFCVVFAGLWLARKQARPGMTLFLSLWCLAPLPAIVLVWKEFGPEAVVALVLLSKIGDICGYYVGSAIGKSHPFPGISPGKTTAGCVASLVGGTIAGGACSWFGLLPGGSEALLVGLVAGATINVASQAGDLLESKIKRLASVKDSGPWFGPAGGVLDLVDSLLLSVPMALLTWPWLFS
jgi:CDP-diglyceride synthetase